LPFSKSDGESKDGNDVSDWGTTLWIVAGAENPSESDRIKPNSLSLKRAGERKYGIPSSIAKSADNAWSNRIKLKESIGAVSWKWFKAGADLWRHPGSPAVWTVAGAENPSESDRIKPNSLSLKRDGERKYAIPSGISEAADEVWSNRIKLKKSIEAVSWKWFKVGADRWRHFGSSDVRNARVGLGHARCANAAYARWYRSILCPGFVEFSVLMVRFPADKASKVTLKIQRRRFG
jgi:hypothetical protein